MSEPIYEALVARHNGHADTPVEDHVMDRETLVQELTACAAYADGTRGDRLVELADFTRRRIAEALRRAAETLQADHAFPTPIASSGVDRIAAERMRQIFEKGHDPVLDIGRENELLRAADSLLMVGQLGLDSCHNPDGSYAPPGGWPWGEASWPMADDRIGNLTIAGALIAAAIDALDPAIQLDRTTT